MEWCDSLIPEQFERERVAATRATLDRLQVEADALRRGCGAAIAAIVLGYLSILTLLGTIIALALTSAANAH